MRRKVLLVAMLILTMLLQCIMPFTTAYATTSVGITLNLNLYKAIKAQLEEQGIEAEYKDANGLIITTQAEIDKVTNLNLENSEIDDLTGLDAFRKVTTLNLHANKLTVNSNLSVLDNLALTDLDLSSNQLESVRSITTFRSIPVADITDQRITARQIIKVDDSEETESRESKVTVTLPDILLEDVEYVKPEWLLNNIGELSRTIEPYTDPATDVTTSPEIDYASSFAPGTTDLVINVARGTASNYEALRGLIKFEIRVNESTSKLANTHMIFYFAIVNNEETGIAFDDDNMYKAVRNQLKKDQTINTELTETTRTRDIYARTYDEALIMVITDNDVVNNVPSLILNDKKIKDIKGLEEFIGLESNLDISYNYIESVEKIIELEENKIAKEQEIRDKYSESLEPLKTNVAAYDAELAKAKTAQEKYDKAAIELAALTDPAAKAAKQNEMQGYLDEKSAAELAASRHLTLIKKYVKKLYNIYEREYRLITLLPKDVNYLSYEDLLKANLGTVKGYSTSIMDRVSAMEKTNALTDYENWAIRKLMTTWASSNGSVFKTTKTVYKPDPADPTRQISEEKPIEYPITEFFNEAKADGTLDITDFEEFVYIFKCIDALSQTEHYSLIKRTLEATPTPVGTDFVVDALNDIKRLYEQKGYDSYFYDLIVANASILADNNSTGAASSGYEINQPSGLFPVQIGLVTSQFTGALSDANKEAYTIKLGHRQSAITAEDIETYISLPRVQKIDMADNKTYSLEGLDQLSELKELNAWKNMVNDISTVDWSKYTRLKKLNLGYNQISNISPLEVIHTLEELNVSYNLLSGRFTFILINMKDLKVADFSHNQYSDIQYANDQFILKAMGYDDDGDGIAEGYTVPEYLEAADITLSFQYQTLSMSTTLIKTSDEFIEFELPLIFRQLEQIDNARTSFGVDSVGGLVEPEGKTVKFKTPEVGMQGTTTVSVQGRNGYVGEANEVYTGVGYGTICKIHYTVVAEPPTRPYEPLNPTPTTPTDPSSPTNPGSIRFGYDISGDYVFVYAPSTTKTTFISTLVDLNEYDVTISQNGSEEKITTGAVVTVTGKNDSSVEKILEVVVKGDINGDGVVDGTDSGIIRNVIADREERTGASKTAADVNCDGSIDSLDSMLILKYRADRISDFKP